MVLWEMTLATAYFLGLKRTYKLVLKIQRRLVSPRHPRIRQFLHRRTRAIFDVALKVHRSIQHRDIEVGKNPSNRILRFLDRMKPSAEIRGGGPPSKPTGNSGPRMNKTEQVKSSSNQKSLEGLNAPSDGKSDRLMFTSRMMSSNRFPAISMVMRPAKPVGSMTQYMHFNTGGFAYPREAHLGGKWDGVIRKDIMQWMLQK